MHGFKGERVLMRLHVEEQDRYKGRPLYRAILEMLRQRHFAGATVLQATLGFGPSGHLHAERTWSIHEDVPIVIEVVDTEEKILGVLPEIDAMMGGGLVTLERVRVIMYRSNVTPDERAEDHDIDVTGSWRVVPPPS